MQMDIPYTSIMTSFIFFEKLESTFGPAVPNTPSPWQQNDDRWVVLRLHGHRDALDGVEDAAGVIVDFPSRSTVTAKMDE